VAYNPADARTASVGSRRGSPRSSPDTSIRLDLNQVAPLTAVSVASPRETGPACRLLADAENELGVVGHALGRPGWIPGQLDVDVLHAGNLARDAADVLLNHR